MNLFDIDLKAGIGNHNAIRGRYFRIITGTGRMTLRTSTGHSSDIMAGIGVDVAANGAPFEWFELVSPVDQTVTILVSDLPSTDSRLSGDIDINGLLSVAAVGGNSITESSGTIANNASVEILTADINRIETVVYIDQPAFVSGANPASAASFPLPAGYHTFKNTAAVYMFNNSGAVLNYKTFGDSK
ncbi:hypothetical protein [Alkalimarinus coralli]|uniref:hypothetical protein n=1 Tax=Alkalimarinus coralli TaxID=2935863 RepID=UPI00202ACEEF|nr:hypothetical protein [Alkalimarinus coralli]